MSNFPNGVPSIFNPRLAYFVSCSAHSSFTSAAKVMGLTLSALSLAMKKLEEEIGARLFDRRKKGIVLTAEGRMLLKAVAQCQSQFAERFAQAADQESQAVLRIGAVMQFGLYSLMPVLERHQKKLPPVQLSLAWSLSCLEAVLSKKLDFAFVSWQGRPKGVKYLRIRRDEVAVVGLKSRFPEIRSARAIGDLESLPWIAKPKPQDEWTGVLPAGRPGYIVRDLLPLKHLVLAGKGIGSFQLSIFTPQEQKKLSISRTLAQSPGVDFYVIYIEDISESVFRQIRFLVDQLAGR